MGCPICVAAQSPVVTKEKGDYRAMRFRGLSVLQGRLGLTGLVVLFLSIALAVYAFAKPKYAFDTITYLGCTYKAVTGEEWPVVQRMTYEHLKLVFPDRVYREVTESPTGISPYRTKLATDPEVFRQRLGAACYKLGFVGPMVGLTLVGVDPYVAARILAVIPATLFFAIATLWLCRKLPGVAAIPVSIAAAFTGLVQTARYEYPDGLTAIAVGLALICFAESRARLTCVCFLAAMIVRMDAILYFGAFLGFSVFLAGADRRIRFGEAVLWGAAALAIYGTISGVMETPSFTNAFYHSFIAQRPYLIDANVVLTISDYVDVLVRQIGVVAGKSAKYPVLIALAAAAYILSFKVREDRFAGDLALVSLLMVTFHFLFIPWFDTRYYAAPYMMVVCGFGIVVYSLGREWVEKRRETKHRV